MKKIKLLFEKTVKNFLFQYVYTKEIGYYSFE